MNGVCTIHECLRPGAAHAWNAVYRCYGVLLESVKVAGEQLWAKRCWQITIAKSRDRVRFPTTHHHFPSSLWLEVKRLAFVSFCFCVFSNYKISSVKLVERKTREEKDGKKRKAAFPEYHGNYLKVFGVGGVMSSGVIHQYHYCMIRGGRGTYQWAPPSSILHGSRKVGMVLVAACSSGIGSVTRYWCSKLVVFKSDPAIAENSRACKTNSTTASTMRPSAYNRRASGCRPRENNNGMLRPPPAVFLRRFTVNPATLIYVPRAPLHSPRCCI